MCRALVVDDRRARLLWRPAAATFRVGWRRSRQYRKQYGKIGGARRGVLRETISVPPSDLGRCRIVPTQRPFFSSAHPAGAAAWRWRWCASGYERDDLSGLRDIRVSRLIIRLMASDSCPSSQGGAPQSPPVRPWLLLNARPWVARGLPSLLLDVASPTPHAGGAGRGARRVSNR